MICNPTRRSLIASAVSGPLCGILSAHAESPAAPSGSAPRFTSADAGEAFTALEARHGGRLGVVAADRASGRRIDHRADERFPMCSTHKLLTAAAILTMVERGRLSLDRLVAYDRADLLEYAPVTRRNVDTGVMTVDALCQAAVEWSDNTAGNLLLGLIGGPPGWTGYVRSLGDTTSRLDRSEPALNTAIPGDPRDTTSPDAMVRDLGAVLGGNILGEVSRSRLEAWMFDGTITGRLLRAGLPDGWRVGDKSGAGERGTRNDVGMMRPPGRSPLLAAVYYTESAEPPLVRDKIIADVGAIIARTFG